MIKLFSSTIVEGNFITRFGVIALTAISLVGCGVSRSNSGGGGGGAGGGGGSPGAPAAGQPPSVAYGWWLYSDSNMELGSPSSASATEHRVIGSGGGGSAYQTIVGTSSNYKLKGGVQ